MLVELELRIGKLRDITIKGDVLWFDKNKVPLNEPRLLETGELAFDGTSIDFFFA